MLSAVVERFTSALTSFRYKTLLRLNSRNTFVRPHALQLYLLIGLDDLWIFTLCTNTGLSQTIRSDLIKSRFKILHSDNLIRMVRIFVCLMSNSDTSCEAECEYYKVYCNTVLRLIRTMAAHWSANSLSLVSNPYFNADSLLSPLPVLEMKYLHPLKAANLINWETVRRWHAFTYVWPNL